MRQLKRFSLETHQTLTSAIENAVRAMLANRETRETRKPTRLPTFKGDGLLPGIDLDSSAALLDRMEER